jgi:hypothetical protein
MSDKIKSLLLKSRLNDYKVINSVLYYSCGFWFICFYSQWVDINFNYFSSPPSFLDSFQANSLLFLNQGENIVVFFVFALILMFFSGFRLGWLFSRFIFIFFSILILMDQLYFSIFKEHATLSVIRDAGLSPWFLLDSAISMINPSFLIGLLILTFLIILSFDRFFSVMRINLFSDLGLIFSLKSEGRIWLRYLMSGWVLVNLCLLGFIPSSKLGRNPFINLLLNVEVRKASSQDYCRSISADEYSDRLIFGKNKPESAAIVSLIQNLKTRKIKKNLILIVLESVGYRQLFKNGELNASLVPSLSKLAKNSILFDQVYTTSPGSLRTHLALHTGGETMTRSLTGADLKFKYQGPTLVGEFKKRGYRTALFSSPLSNFGGISNFYRGLGWDQMINAPDLSPLQRSKWALNSWGVRDDLMANLAAEWIINEANRREPYFLEFMNIASHHPYDMPDGFNKLFQGKSLTIREKYANSIYYFDQVLGKLIDKLEEKGALDRTVLAIMGDHGESFGEYHPGSFSHDTNLYDETVRSFLLIYDRDYFRSKFNSKKSGSVADVAPTVLSYIFPKDQSFDSIFFGKSLLDQNYQEKIKFLHNVLPPRHLGLLDGNYKFIAKQFVDGEFELYDLAQDPLEKNNLSDRFPLRLRKYDCLVERWFSSFEGRLQGRLEGYQGVRIDPNIFDEGLRRSGSVRIDFERKKRQGETARSAAEFRVGDEISVLIHAANHEHSRDLSVYYVAPDLGRVFIGAIKTPIGGGDLYMSRGVSAIMRGIWTVQILDTSDPSKVIAEKSLEVR